MTIEDAVKYLESKGLNVSVRPSDSDNLAYRFNVGKNGHALARTFMAPAMKEGYNAWNLELEKFLDGIVAYFDKYPKLKVGDKFKVVRADHSGKEQYIGRVFTVRKVDHALGDSIPMYGVEEPCMYMFREDEITPLCSYDDKQFNDYMIKTVSDSIIKGFEDGLKRSTDDPAYQRLTKCAERLLKNSVYGKTVFTKDVFRMGDFEFKHKENGNIMFSYVGGNKDCQIKKVHFNDPMTIVIWSDGTKTIVKAKNEEFDPEKGLAMAIAKKAMGNKYSYIKEFEKWIPKKEEEPKPIGKVTSVTEKDDSITITVELAD